MIELVLEGVFMNAEAIIEWREAIISLPQEHFFDLMCSYLGEIKTPFNKQKLLEQLSSFLRKPQTKKNIAQSLDAADILFLTAIKYISEPTQNIIANFFCGEFSLLEIYGKLINLEERLLIYRTQKQKITKEKIYKINPLLFEDISPMLDKALFFMPDKKGKSHDNTLFNNVFFAGLYSFIFHNADILKKDGTLKKRIEDIISEIFPYINENPKRFNLILHALYNLGMLFKTEKGLELQTQKWKSFGKLSFIEKTAYICTAAAGKLNKEDLQKAAQSFIDLILYFEEGFLYKETSVRQNYFLLYKNNFKSADADLFNLFWKESEDTSYSYTGINVLRAAEILGIFCRDGEFIFLNSEIKKAAEYSKVPFFISASFEVTMEPYVSLENIIDILPCMEPVSIQTIGIFSITRKTCGSFFKTEVSAETLCKELNELTEYKIPQNIIVSINQWYKNYSAVSVYDGIVICVSKEKEKFFSQDTAVSKLIYKKLSDGVYLMKKKDFKEIENAACRTGLDFIFYKNIDSTVKNLIPFFNLELNKIQKTNLNKIEWQKSQKERSEKYLSRIKELQNKIETQSLKKEEQKILRERILRRVIIDEQQIKASTIRSEDKEASGVNFFGKLRIAEAAIAEKHFLEIYFNDGRHLKTILGLPVSVQKESTDAKLNLISEPEKKEINVSIAQALKIKVVRNSIFS